jgi:hypothetical protein
MGMQEGLHQPRGPHLKQINLCCYIPFILQWYNLQTCINMKKLKIIYAVTSTTDICVDDILICECDGITW